MIILVSIEPSGADIRKSLLRDDDDDWCRAIVDQRYSVDRDQTLSRDLLLFLNDPIKLVNTTDHHACIKKICIVTACILANLILPLILYVITFRIKEDIIWKKYDERVNNVYRSIKRYVIDAYDSGQGSSSSKSRIDIQNELYQITDLTLCGAYTISNLFPSNTLRQDCNQENRFESLNFGKKFIINRYIDQDLIAKVSKFINKH